MYVDKENKKGWCLVIQCAPYFSMLPTVRN